MIWGQNRVLRAKVIHMKKSRTFTPHLLFPATMFLLFAGLLFYLLYSWRTGGSIFALLTAIFPFTGAMAFGRPLVFFPHVTISNGNRITIRYWVGKGYTDSISNALYEIVVKNDDIRSYRFRIQRKHFQVSPATYIQGDELTGLLKSFIKRKRLTVSIAAS